MANYFQLRFEYGVGGYAHIETSETLDVQFLTGRMLRGEFPATTVSLRSRPKAPDFIGVGLLDLVSEGLRDFLIAEGGNAEFLVVEVLQGRKRVDGRYYEMNLLDVIACLDRRRSLFQESVLSSGERFVSGIDQLYLDENRLHGSRLFVMDERLVRLVREDLADAWRRAKFTGIGFKALPNGPF